MTRPARMTPLTPIFNPKKQRGGIDVGSTPGTPPTPGGILWTYTSSGIYAVPDSVTEIFIDGAATPATAGSQRTITVTGSPVVVSLPFGSYTWTFAPPVGTTPSRWRANDANTSTTFNAKGAKGAGAGAGLGAEVTCTHSVIGGTDWAVWVGKNATSSPGGWPGGGNGCIANNDGNAGGGLSTVQPSTDTANHVTNIDNAIIVAGAGAGNNNWNGGTGGHGGYPDGTDGGPLAGTKGGLKGTASAGGSGPGNPGTKGQGGHGVSHGAVAWQEGSGGGAGWYGGAATGHDFNSGGGGGGSSKIHAAAILVSSATGTSSVGAVIITI